MLRNILSSKKFRAITICIAFVLILYMEYNKFSVNQLYVFMVILVVIDFIYLLMSKKYKIEREKSDIDFCQIFASFVSMSLLTLLIFGK